jgi:hypothetical protein
MSLRSSAIEISRASIRSSVIVILTILGFRVFPALFKYHLSSRHPDANTDYEQPTIKVGDFNAMFHEDGSRMPSSRYRYNEK